ncbi:nuclear transport factor 2 family protein [Emcibacter nanhaiensis]|uniref:Nuclear transport factor 2 family protein n=1 Tax=Emcibacter nanhaiensis TaxID=1505037 RepID=A0A501PMT8_9PROT|nr:nuclear transport factor 2 family protein [Emcibacter nanhaiensis]TPD61763.1 nuclear transport factor 2 family protein [Emcibacter nanhaiensis]
MNVRTITLGVISVFFLASQALAFDRAAEERAVAALLDGFHDAADKGDKERYLGSMTRDSVFMGTDSRERWPYPEFEKYVGERFRDGKGWSYRSVEKHIDFSPDGRTGWFDEITRSEKWGDFRGTGVVVKEDDAWKIAHYSLTFLVPNQVWEQVSEIVQSATDGN